MVGAPVASIGRLRGTCQIVSVGRGSVRDDVAATGDVVTVRLGKTEFALLPLGRAHAPTRCHAGKRPHRVPPEQHLGVPRLLPRATHPRLQPAERLKTVFSTRAARLGTLHELTKLGPVPIIADALGYHPSTIERHAVGSAAVYSQYIAAARDQRMTP
jgi:hypothetical protein